MRFFMRKSYFRPNFSTTKNFNLQVERYLIFLNRLKFYVFFDHFCEFLIYEI